MRDPVKPERWEQVEKVYQEALRHKQSERAAFLVDACHGDPDMRREVDSLLEVAESECCEPPEAAAGEHSPREGEHFPAQGVRMEESLNRSRP